MTIAACRICGIHQITPFFDFGSLPLPNGFLKREDLKKPEPIFPLRIGFCESCGLVQLLDVVDPGLMFRNYVYLPSASQTRLANFSQIASEMVGRKPPTEYSLALDIGSNDGSLLLEFKRQGVRALGVDPAENLAKIAELKGINTVPEYFGERTAKKILKEYGPVDYMTATNVLAHIDDLHGVMIGVETLLSTSGLFVCEFPYLVDLLEKTYVDTIYHEHLSYFSLLPLMTLLKDHHLKIVDVHRTPIDGGALRLTIANKRSDYQEATASIDELLRLERSKHLNRIETYTHFARNVGGLKKKLQKLLGSFKRQRKLIAGYGASARGNILLNFCGLDHHDIDFLVDSTPYKQGLFTPGHHIPIYPEEELLQRMPDITLMLAWNFAQEILEKQTEYVRRGGQFLVPVPEPTIASPAKKAMKRQKVVVIMPAYNAEKTVAEAYRRLPKKGVDEIILVDDGSSDRTFEVAKKLPIRVFRNHINLGYGGNLKVCLTKSLEAGADIIIEYHPDNQYDPKDLSLFLEKVHQGFGFALGSRFIYPKEALENRMPFEKFLANRAMSWIDEVVLGVEMSEFHSGFRMYTRELLERVPFHQNSDDYLFSFEIIVQAIYYRFRIADVPISCLYHKDMHTANLWKSAIYALGTFKTLGQYLLAKWLKVQTGSFLLLKPIPCPVCQDRVTRREAVVKDAVSDEEFTIWFCSQCQLGFTHPVPTNFSRYYPKDYFSPIKNFVYQLLQVRRPEILKHYMHKGNLLDIGCGDGSIRDTLPEFHYEGVETPFAGARKPFVQTRGVERMNVKPNSKDIVSFWESFEHLADVVDALKKSHRALKRNGILIIECPNWNSIERRIFGNRWFHYDPPRHITHFTPKGLKKLLNDQKFEVVEQKTLFAPEYIPLGFAQSILYLISPSLHLAAQSSKGTIRGVLVGLMILVLLPLSTILTFIFFSFGNSPILLTVARKK